ncbi:MAG TPA: DNA-processing protein DprA [Armatimonadota bacterium]|jgi:DNA processing protein
MEAWVRLSRMELPPRRAKTLLDLFGSPEEVLGASREQLEEVPGLAASTVDRLLSPPTDAEIAKDLARAEKLSVALLPLNHPDYPRRLLELPDPPLMLYVRGSLTEADRFSVALVGSRRASIYGSGMAEKLARDLAGSGFTVVSGLARGIDSAAHRGALQKGRTLACLGCGVDVVYPPENRALADRVMEHGALISENPLGAGPDGWRFPARNRVIAGIALGVVVVEAPKTSGALITAEFAMEQGREVMAVPGPADRPNSHGCHQLIRDGAKLVETAEDILLEFGVPLAERRAEQLPLPLDLTPEEKRVLDLLSLQQRHSDELEYETGWSTAQISALLMMLEVKGLVKRLPGGLFLRCAYG